MSREDISDVLPEVLVRHVTRYIPDEEGEIVDSVEESPPAQYAWLVKVGASRCWVSGDLHLPCIQPRVQDTPAAENSPIVGTLTKVNPATGEIRYGPADITALQLAAWRSAGANLPVKPKK